ncbi:MULTISPECIES: sensor histidine kinase [Dyadobacter]|uniref:histidine kinase n=1 Tax=Dyadobacter psychrotolerans TaxID=2541721 RepID=A0A4R5DMP9_9BACT|nr:HAMP domain-containing sensor histidine kinase [Dyadobacter psychrotolerans]TDE13261.1 HAMP domain-containing histidine kinase [Dyadobacter psychrotolerans]
MKLFTRYNRINLTLMVLLFVLSGISYYFIINYVLIHELDEALEDYQLRIENYVVKQGTLPPVALMDETIVTYSKLNRLTTPIRRMETLRRLDTLENEWHNYRQKTYSQDVGGASFCVTLAKPIEGTKLLTRTVVAITILMLLVIIIASIVLNQVILRKLWQPFYTSLAAMKTFKLGKKQVPEFPLTNIEEFVFMNTLLEDTVTGAEADYQILKEFTENASHEIQTPLAIIRSKLDLVIQEEGLSEKQTLALSSIYSGIKRLTKLNQSLLLLAKIENHQFAGRENVDVEEKVNEKLDQFQEFWQNSKVQFTATIKPSAIHTNPELFDILLSNLISNAGRHNMENGFIFVNLDKNTFVIENTGSLSSLDSQKLYTRFYKESQHSQHNGLGLSIVKQICDQLDIEIKYSFVNNLHRFTLKWD